MFPSIALTVRNSAVLLRDGLKNVIWSVDIQVTCQILGHSVPSAIGLHSVRDVSFYQFLKSNNVFEPFSVVYARLFLSNLSLVT